MASNFSGNADNANDSLPHGAPATIGPLRKTTQDGEQSDSGSMNRERIPPEEAEVIRRWLPRLAPLTVDHPEAPLASPEWRAGFKAATQRIGERLNRLTAPPPIGVTEGWCWRTAGDPSRVAADSHGPPEWGHATPCWIVPKDLTNRMQGMDGVWVLVFDEPTDAEP